VSQSVRRSLAVAVAFAGVLAAAPAAAASFALAPAVNYDPGGDGLGAVAVGDLNGDGRADIVAGDATADGVSVLLSRAGGGLRPAAHYHLGSAPIYGIAIGDLNLDGRPDVVATAQFSDSVRVLHGDGKGGFASPLTYPESGSGPTFVAIGNLNEDGRPDLAVINAGSDDVRVMFQRADGGFNSSAAYLPGAGAESLAIGDLNGDSHPDLAVAGQHGFAYMLATWYGGLDPIGPPTTYTTPTAVDSLKIGDLNGDRRPDLVAANLTNADPNGVSVLFAASYGGFLDPVTYATDGTVGAVGVRDMDRDGRPDLAVSNITRNTAGVMLGRRGGGFAAPIERTVSAGGLAIGDMNGDGLPDLVTANYSQTVSVLRNASTPTVGLSVTALRFGRQGVGSRSASRVVTLRNTGAARLRPSALRVIGPDADEFRISGESCIGASLPPGKACRVAVRFAPVATGPGRAVLRIRSNDPTSPALVALRGTGVRAP
jgi:hypothetical protein